MTRKMSWLQDRWKPDYLDLGQSFYDPETGLHLWQYRMARTALRWSMGAGALCGAIQAYRDTTRIAACRAGNELPRSVEFCKYLPDQAGIADVFLLSTGLCGSIGTMALAGSYLNTSVQHIAQVAGEREAEIEDALQQDQRTRISLGAVAKFAWGPVAQTVAVLFSATASGYHVPLALQRMTESGDISQGAGAAALLASTAVGYRFWSMGQEAAHQFLHQRAHEAARLLEQPPADNQFDYGVAESLRIIMRGSRLPTRAPDVS